MASWRDGGIHVEVGVYGSRVDRPLPQTPTSILQFERSISMNQALNENQQLKLNGSALLWLDKLQTRLEQFETLSLESLEPEDTALVIIDMTNGFAREGLLASPRVGALIPGIASLAEACLGRHIPVIAPSDTHTPDAEEFSTYPAHCMAGSQESALVSELTSLERIIRLDKNSTQIWHSQAFQDWFRENERRSTWILTGDCTDICVLQFALVLKTFFQSKNRPSRVIVPINAVNTFETPDHPGDLYHLMALALMDAGGLELVKGVEVS
ncbi:MAG: isochorismatase family protein [Acidaminobacter sp.]|uniref:cysteine hydrolase family protein n=1 Tax=Acidaminobacter sp. TaxID=1872102 RepID=UPI00137E6DC3|nr:isochorismatase family cysteine hydrolase [Acidaminobacter sp.]MZQ98059.1 isochorismatase family protein [Acidaminobacter sp.]